MRPWPPEEGWWDITPRSAVRQASKQGDEECKSHVKEDSNYSNFSRILERKRSIQVKSETQAMKCNREREERAAEAENDRISLKDLTNMNGKK